MTIRLLKSLLIPLRIPLLPPKRLKGRLELFPRPLKILSGFTALKRLPLLAQVRRKKKIKNLIVQKRKIMSKLMKTYLVVSVTSTI